MNSIFITRIFKQIFESQHLESYTFSPLLSRFILKPLSRLYVYGPTWMGMWGGKHAHDICAQLTNTPSDVWIRNKEDCMTVIGRSFYSIVIVIETLLYMGLMYWGIKISFGVFWLVGLFVYRKIKRGFEQREKVGKSLSSFLRTGTGEEGGVGTVDRVEGIRNIGKKGFFNTSLLSDDDDDDGF